MDTETTIELHEISQPGCRSLLAAIEYRGCIFIPKGLRYLRFNSEGQVQESDDREVWFDIPEAIEN